MFNVGDVVKVKGKVWSAMFSKRSNLPNESPEGPVYWIHPAGVRRLMIKGHGWQFKQEDVELLYVDVDVSEYDD